MNPERERDDRRERYEAGLDLAGVTETVSWERFYNFLTATSVIIAAWTLIFTAREPHNKHLLIVLNGFGILLGIAWSALGWRSRRYQEAYMFYCHWIETGKPLPSIEDLREEFNLWLKQREPQEELEKSTSFGPIIWGRSCLNYETKERADIDQPTEDPANSVEHVVPFFPFPDVVGEAGGPPWDEVPKDGWCWKKTVWKWSVRWLKSVFGLLRKYLKVVKGCGRSRILLPWMPVLAALLQIYLLCVAIAS